MKYSQVNLISGAQNRQLHRMLHQLNLTYCKPSLVSQYTNQRTEHSSELHFNEAANLLSALKFEELKRKGIVKTANEFEPKQVQDDKAATGEASSSRDYAASDRIRKKVLYFAHQLFWHVPATNKIDFDRLDAWCLTHGPCGKPFQQHSKTDLIKLVYAFERFYISTVRSSASINNKASTSSNINSTYNE